ncbi:30S ribosomal protein S12 methylthiotransferase RimO [Fidelibacter multiformis]|uniref:30S ribosomal protein S12 methylthiotransferase RimO n=1 Tax=Fidelibacter multiformis TaxID=3377529 RepID=UPI0037DC57DF
MRIHLITMGCSKNLVDSEVLKGGLEKAGLELTSDPLEADTIIINTCGFIEEAREENIDVTLAAAELKKTGKLQRLILIGCLPQIYERELREAIPEVDAFFGVDKMQEVIRYLSGDPTYTYDPVAVRSLMTPRHYAYLKISEGCNNRCSFCSIPIIRGPQKSRTVDTILRESRHLIQMGVKEIILIAQDSTMYGKDLSPRVTLTDLLKEMESIDIPWIRLHYGHPAHIPPGLFEHIARSERIVPYVDLPIQHINTRILQLMQRGQSSEGIRKVLEKARNTIPNVTIRTTLITGYPTETESEFEEMLEFVRSFRFDRLGAFKYSREDYTPAAHIPDDIPDYVKSARYDAILSLQQEISLMKNREKIGSTQKVLIDTVNQETGVSFGRTEGDSPDIDNQVIIDSPLTEGCFYDVTITDASEYDLTGKLG